jgi:type I restriction enzyme M protein
MTAPALVQKLWNYCNILCDDGLSYGDYVEQLTFLLFDSLFHRSDCAQTSGLPLSASLRLKMADEQSRPPYNKPSPYSQRRRLG